jgi:hypothetical protein
LPKLALRDRLALLVAILNRTLDRALRNFLRAVMNSKSLRTKLPLGESNPSRESVLEMWSIKSPSTFGDDTTVVSTRGIAVFQRQFVLPEPLVEYLRALLQNRIGY